MFIPHTSLSPATLRKVVEEFVTREGTDYGPSVHTLDTKVQAVLRQLNEGNACLVFDTVSESCDIVIKGTSRYKQIKDSAE
jgi:uncharacterized protein YheU (UPF0270 family)